jgi:mediator of replication checkpoint protein 1
MDEKQVSKLMKDITTGALRRRRGADNDLDLDDSDEERAARRRDKQRANAKMLKALLADEKVNEIAKNPKKEAFFKTLEDRENDDMDFEFEHVADSQEASSESVEGETVPAAHDSGNASNKRKRPLKPAAEDATNRPPPHLRRTAASASRKPSSLSEIRESLSFLTATPEYDSFSEDASVEEEIVYDTDKGTPDDDGSGEPEKRISTGGFAVPPNPRRTRGRVVDRLALKRAASSNSASANTKAAFMTGSDALSHVGFRPPALLRRSTTTSSSTSGGTSFSTTRNKNSAAGTRPAVSTTKGAVNYYTAARERERERELRLGDSGNKSSATAALLKQRALSSGLMALSKDQWE